MKSRSIFDNDDRKKKKAETQKTAQKTAQPTATPPPGRRVMDALTGRRTLSIFLLLAFMLAVLAIIFFNPLPYQSEIQEGDISLKDIYAPYDFTYAWGINEKMTEAARENAAKKVSFSIRRDSELEKDLRSRLEGFFNLMKEEKARDIPVEEKVSSLKEKTISSADDRNLRVMLEYKDTEALKKGAIDIINDVFVVGFAKDEDLNFLSEKNITKVTILNEEDGKELERTTEVLLDKNKAKKIAGDYAAKYFPHDRKIRAAVEEIANVYATPNLKLDEKTTSSRRETARKEALPVYNKWEVKKNELIIEKGERVNARHIAQLTQIRRPFLEGKPTAFFTGLLLLFLLLGFIAFIYQEFTGKVNFLVNPKELSIILLNMLFIIVVADFIIRGAQPTYFIPLASIGMIIKLLIGFSPAFLSVAIMSVAIAVLAGGKVEVALVLLIGSLAGIHAVRGARRRATIVWAGFVVGIAKFLAIICAGLVNGIEASIFLRDGLWGILSGVISGFIVLGLLPLFEHLFKVPTNISLLELSDLNHPLLKQLAIEAPGTYHHSILVGNLAEVACDSIGANSLLARVGSYYHDIGKIAKASYFSENEMGAGSKHAKLTPSMSALIISKHVKEGLEMARKHKLNSAILEFIGQHHGDSLISYFYQKAIEKSENGVVTHEENFRYPGPKPQTKETAIVLLADAVEAASRTLDEPTPASIRNLVKKIINNKFIDGQLDECDLTLKDIHRIAESFARVLMGIFHTRLDYPEESGGKEEKPYNADKNKLRKSKQEKKD
ncbi:MAG: HDIG domain-containing protein [Candidatus Omnitrophota bacterium]|jgi:putative nucleotidyltransferase with HDIG domain